MYAYSGSVISIAYLRTGSRWFDLRLGQKSLRQDSFLCHCCLLFRQWLCAKAASGLERILCGVLVKKLQESMDRFTGRRVITEILLKSALNAIQSITDLTTIKKKGFENIVGKGENAGRQHFLFFTHCFLPLKKK